MSENMNNGWFCPACGNSGNTGNFCGKCGAAKPVQTYVPQTAAPVPQGKTFSAQDKKRANSRCIISLILTIGVPLVEAVILSISKGIGYDANDLYRLSGLLSDRKSVV